MGGVLLITFNCYYARNQTICIASLILRCLLSMGECSNALPLNTKTWEWCYCVACMLAWAMASSNCTRFCGLCWHLVLSGSTMRLFTVTQTSTQTACHDNNSGFGKRVLKMFMLLLHRRLLKHPVFPDFWEIKCMCTTVYTRHSFQNSPIECEHLGTRLPKP